MTTVIDKIETALANHTDLGNVEKWVRCPVPAGRRYGRNAPMFEVVLVGGDILGLATLFEARAFVSALDSVQENVIRVAEAEADRQAREALARAERQAAQKELDAAIVNAADCFHCGAGTGEKCETHTPNYTRPHKARVDAASVVQDGLLAA